MKMDRVSLEIALADGAFACHELNAASTGSEDGGFSCAARIESLKREMCLLMKGQTSPGIGFTDIDLEAIYLAANAGAVRLTAIVEGHCG